MPVFINSPSIGAEKRTLCIFVCSFFQKGKKVPTLTPFAAYHKASPVYGAVVSKCSLILNEKVNHLLGTSIGYFRIELP